MKENNELIAEFMGFFPFESMPVSKQKIYKLLDLNGNPIHPYYGPFRSEQMQFNRSWDWLMPVVEKIERLGQRCEIGITKCKIYSADYTVDPTYGATKIQATYDAVVKFIQWYNTTKQPQPEQEPGSQDVKPGEL